MLQKIKKSYFFSDKFFSLILVFFISFSIFSYSFAPKKCVYADTIVSPLERDFGAILLGILGTLGVTVSLQSGREFVHQQIEKTSELSKQMANGTLPIQQLRDKGYYCSKEFINSVISDWNYYTSSHTGVDELGWSWFLTPDLDKVGFKWKSSLSTTENLIAIGNVYEKYIGTNYLHCPIGSRVTFYCGGQYWDSVSKYGFYKIVPNGEGFVVYDGTDFFVSMHTDSSPTLIKYRVDNEGVNTKVDDSIIKPLTDKQGLYLPMPVIKNVSKVLDNPVQSPSSINVKTTPVGNVNVGNPVDIPVGGAVPSDVPSIVDGGQVGAVPWSSGNVIPKPVEGADGKPVSGSDSKPVDKPVDGSDSKPIDKPVGGIGENIWDKILEFLKKILIPSDSFFIDEFKSLEGELNGKFNGNGLNYISDFKNNSKSVDPKFIYTFTIMGTTVTLDFSFITRIVPLCHIVFGGLTLLFLAWYHYKNVLLLIRGISPVEGGNFTGNSSGGGIDFKAMGDTAPSSPVSTGSFGSPSKGNGNYSTTNKYSGGGSK